jgi:hypothetical protein
MAEGESDRDWQAVIGRALAFICLAQADLRDKGLAPQAEFLESLGLSRKEAAGLLGTTPGSLTELLSQSRKKKKGGKGGKAEKKGKGKGK